VGGTTSADFPTKNPLQPAQGSQYSWGYDAFVTKVNSSGAALVYSTYLGGDFDDIAWSVALDSNGNACLAGGTTSDNFPTVKPLQPSFGGGVMMPSLPSWMQRLFPGFFYFPRWQ